MVWVEHFNMILNELGVKSRRRARWNDIIARPHHQQPLSQVLPT